MGLDKMHTSGFIDALNYFANLGWLFSNDWASSSAQICIPNLRLLP